MPKSSAGFKPKLEPEEPTSTAVFRPGFGCKGEGKSANYGVAIPPPRLLAPVDVPAALQQPGSSSGFQGVQALSFHPEIPPPIPATTEVVEQWMSSSFKALTNISTKTPPEIGECILWRGLKTTRSGQPSTKLEYFNGKVRHMEFDDDNELFLYLD